MPISIDSVAGLYCSSSVFSSQAKALAAELNIPLSKTPPKQIQDPVFLLTIGEQGLALQAAGKKAPGPIMVDFVGGTNAHRRQFGGGKGQMIAKAVGLKGSYKPHVLDVTAGLGQDGFVLATLGCRLSWVERSPVVYHLLHDGLERASLSADFEVRDILSRIDLTHRNSIDYLCALEDPVDVIYLDPMFPERNSKAEVNKNMKAFHALVGEDNDAGQLLETALTKAEYRVVVKRPRKAPTIGDQHPDVGLPKPSVVFEGKSTRFDVYTLKKMP